MCFSLEGKRKQNTLLGYYCSCLDRSSFDMRRNWPISYLCLEAVGSGDFHFSVRLK